MSKKYDIIMDAIMIMVFTILAITVILMVVLIIIDHELRVVFGSIIGLIVVSFLIAWIKNSKKGR